MQTTTKNDPITTYNCLNYMELINKILSAQGCNLVTKDIISLKNILLTYVIVFLKQIELHLLLLHSNLFCIHISNLLLSMQEAVIELSFGQKLCINSTNTVYACINTVKPET